MEELSFVDATKRFAELMNRQIKSPPRTAKAIVESVVSYFRDIRVTGAREKLQFEWGSMRPHLIDRFTDIRTEEWGGWDEVEYKWIGVSREIAINEDDDDTVWCVFIYFEKSTGDEPSANAACGRKSLDTCYSGFLKEPYVAQLLEKQPSRVTAFASEVG